MEETTMEESFHDQWKQFSQFVCNWKMKNFEVQGNTSNGINQHKKSSSALLLLVGGREATDILTNHTFTVNDMKRINSALLRLEELFLFKLFNLYQLFKQSLLTWQSKDSFDIDTSVNSNTAICKENKSNTSQLLKDESTSLTNNENSYNVIVEFPTMKTETQYTKQNGGKLEKDVSNMNGSDHKIELDNVESSNLLTEDVNLQSCIRRSSRQIKVSSKYAENKDKIQSLLKPNIFTERNDSSEPPCLCSVCKKLFSNSEKLVSHWKSHKAGKNHKPFPFLCKSCGYKSKNFNQLKKHYKQHDQKFNNLKNTSGKQVSSKIKNLSLNKSQNDESGDQLSINPQIEINDVMKSKSNDCNVELVKTPQLKIETESGDNKNVESKEIILLNNDATKTTDKKSVDYQTSVHKKRSYGKKGEFKCNFCNKFFSYERNLKDHLAIHTGEKSQVCGVCSKAFRLRRTLLTHMRHHDEKYVLKCELCPKTFIDKKALEVHKLLHSGTKPYSCEICGKEFRRLMGLKNHRRLHKTAEAIKCDICEKTFVDKWGMLKHKTIHTGVKPFVCSHCGKMFRLKKGLLDHLKLHDKALRLKCDLCPRTFVEQRKLKLHLMAHKGEKHYICDKCGKGFMNSMNLKVHNRCHTGEKPYTCSYCERSFNQQGSLIAHERNHKGERPYLCNICGEGFITKSQLTIHIRKHFNDRPYKCDKCDYAAYTGSSLKIHKVKHSDAKPFKCKQCPSTFKRSHHLEAHRRAHMNNIKVLAEDDCNDNEVAFKCPYCEETFHSEDSLWSHMPTHEILVVTETSAGEFFPDQGTEEVAFDIVLI